MADTPTAAGPVPADTARLRADLEKALARANEAARLSADARDDAADMLRQLADMRKQLSAAESLSTEYQVLFDLQQTRLGKATAAWRAESPADRAHVIPDLGRLLDWLLDREPTPIKGSPAVRHRPAVPSWRVVFTDSETADGIAPVCPRQDDVNGPHGFYEPGVHMGADNMTVFNCCPPPHLQGMTLQAARRLTEVLNAAYELSDLDSRFDYGRRLFTAVTALKEATVQ